MREQPKPSGLGGNLMDREKMKQLAKLATLIRYYILTMTTEAGSGHPTSHFRQRS